MLDLIPFLEALFAWLPTPFRIVTLSCMVLSVALLVVDVVSMCWRFVKG